VRKLNAGDYTGACNQLLRWNRAGGKEVRGLTRRRVAERELCLKPVNNNVAIAKT
jgi:lysozyme